MSSSLEESSTLESIAASKFKVDQGWDMCLHSFYGCLFYNVYVLAEEYLEYYRYLIEII